MSLGSIIGGVAGGIIGFIYGGPVGAAYGIAIGAGIGYAIDPVNPGIQDRGKPQISELNITLAKEGEVIPDLLGTSQITGNIIQYWGNRTEEIKEEQETGKGGGDADPTTVGYKYYLSWLQAICIGPVDYLYAIYKEENLVWAGELSKPASGGQQTITLKEYSDDNGGGTVLGNMTFYFGTNDHALNTDYEAGISDSTLNIPYRNLCYAFFDDFYIGDYNRASSFRFIVGKRPTLSFNSNKTINTYDYNPAHAIYYILNNMLDLPTSFIDDTTFSTVANTLNTENFGVSILFDRPLRGQDYLDNILFHINAIKYYDTDGKLKLKLLRKDEAV